MAIFINRILNMKKIKAIGFDMDYTLVRYHTENFERLSHGEALKKLCQIKNYPQEICQLNFDFHQVIQGLVIDRKRGNILKVNRFGKAKYATHGLKAISYPQLQRLYGNQFVDLNDENYQSLDTSFSISNGVLFGQLVELKDQGLALPDYETMSYDIKEIIDIAHSDGTLKGAVRKNIAEYIISEPSVATLLERLKSYDKQLILITNSDYHYSKLLMEYSVDPYLEEHKSWRELFDIIITLSAKPRFFTTDSSRFLAVDPDTGLMSNYEGEITTGIFQGGNAKKLQRDLKLDGEEILYLGDHIYGDVVSLKKASQWRTGLVLEPLLEEVEAITKSKTIQEQIDLLMEQKESLEHKLNVIDLKKHQDKAAVDKKNINQLFSEIEKINQQISDLLDQLKNYYNPHWGELMRSGQEESRFADQVEKYACIYMSKVSDMIDYSPKTYFRPKRRSLPHDL